MVFHIQSLHKEFEVCNPLSHMYMYLYTKYVVVYCNNTRVCRFVSSRDISRCILTYQYQISNIFVLLLQYTTHTDPEREQEGRRRESESVSIESSELRPEGPQVSGGDGTTSSLASFSLDTQSLNCLPLREVGREPDTVSLQAVPRRSSLGLGQTSPRGLRAVFSRSR